MNLVNDLKSAIETTNLPPVSITIPDSELQKIALYVIITVVIIMAITGAFKHLTSN